MMTALVVGTLLTGAYAAASVTGGRTRKPAAAGAVAPAQTNDDLLQERIDAQMAEDAELASAERAAVAAVRADLNRSEAQQRVIVGGIREDYRALTQAALAKRVAKN